MFRDEITRTPFTARGLNFVVNGETGSGDMSFIVTLRALLQDKLESAGESVYFQYYSNINVLPEDICHYSSALSYGNTGVISLLSVRVTSKDGDLRKYVAGFKEWMRGQEDVARKWSELQRVTAFFAKAFEVYCFINEEDKNVILFTTGMDLKKYHYIQCAIPAFMPWYFPKDQGLSEDEMALIKSLTSTDSGEYIRIINKMADTMGLEGKRLADLLKGIEFSTENERALNIRSRIEDIIRNLDDLDLRMGELLKNKSTLETDLLGIEMKLASGEGSNELLEYFMCNKKLSLEDRYGSVINFTVRDYLTYFDDEMAAAMINNKNSYVYSGGIGKVSKRDMKDLMRAIFIDEDLKIRFCAAYSLNIGGTTVQGIGEFGFGSSYADCTPNPHIQNYTCLGDHKRHIINRMREHDYIGAIEQCVASTKSLNFGDSTVMLQFMRVMYGFDGYGNANRKFIELPDGDVVRPEDAVAWLKKTGYIKDDKEVSDE